MSTDPFKGRKISTPPPMRVLHRFEKPGQRADIREPNVTEFQAIECFVVVDGWLVESQLFHNGRELEYPKELAKRLAQFAANGWIEER